jgi:3-phosphoshikimate 1-carboxyvinyltransferase
MSDAVPILTIDGPSGSGKGTISRLVAMRLGWQLLDSGALYRLVALAGQQSDLMADDVPGHTRLAGTMQVRFATAPDGGEQVLLGSPPQDVTTALRSEEAGQGASRVAAWPAIRNALFERQRAFARPPGLVADGRDMGTVVFPDATLKVFLTASAAERAERRHKQLISKGISSNIDDLRTDLEVRDARDQSRKVAPLKPAEDAVSLDNSHLTIEASAEQVLSWWRDRRPFD